jgi:hypothetical protein
MSERICFEAKSGYNLFLIISKDLNFEPKVGYCTAVNEHQNVQKPEEI